MVDRVLDSSAVSADRFSRGRGLRRMGLPGEDGGGSVGADTAVMIKRE